VKQIQYRRKIRTTNKRRYSEIQHIDYTSVTFAIVRIHSQIAKYSITQFMCENSRERILATPTDDDTFLNKEKGCLFVLTAADTLLLVFLQLN